jgi:hypothetical protein
MSPMLKELDEFLRLRLEGAGEVRPPEVRLLRQ